MAALKSRAMILAERKDARAIADLDALVAAEPRNAQYVYQRGLMRERQQESARSPTSRLPSPSKEDGGGQTSARAGENDSKRWKAATRHPPRKQKSDANH